MAKAYTFDDLIKRNKKIANTYISGGGDEASGEIVDVPNDPAASKKLYGVIPSKGYTEWLMAGGMYGQAQKEYDAAVRAAETDYAKTLALYGQNAETLGRAGLTGSGYTDYLTGAGFSAMQGAKVAAADTKALTEAQQRLSYADYLAGVDAQNAQLAAQNAQLEAQEAAKREATAASIKSTIDQMVQSGMDDKSIMAYVRQHYGDEFLGYVGDWIGISHMYMDPLLAKNATEQAVQYKQQIYSMLASGQSAEDVRANMQYVMGLTGADTSQLDTWIAEAQAAAQPTVDALNAEKTAAETEAANARQQQANAAYASLIGGDTRYAPAVAERELKNAGYSDDEILAARTNFQANNFDTGANNIEMATTAEQLADYSSEALELSVQAGVLSGIQAAQLKQQARAKRAALLIQQLEDLADSDSETANADAEALFKQIDKLKADDLADDGRAALYALRAEAYLNTAKEGKAPLTDVVQSYFDLGLDDDDANGASAEGFIRGIADNVQVINVNNDSQVITFYLGKKDNGKASIETLGYITKPMNEKEQQQATEVLGKADAGDIKVYNGKLCVRRSDGEWHYVDRIRSVHAGSKDNAKLIYDILVDYYS